MRNLSRILALNAVLILTGLAIPVSADPTGHCLVRCYGLPLRGAYSVTATQADCCAGNVPNECPPDKPPIPHSWNAVPCAN